MIYCTWFKYMIGSCYMYMHKTFQIKKNVTYAAANEFKIKTWIKSATNNKDVYVVLWEPWVQTLNKQHILCYENIKIVSFWFLTSSSLLINTHSFCRKIQFSLDSGWPTCVTEGYLRPYSWKSFILALLSPFTLTDVPCLEPPSPLSSLSS